MHGKITFNYLLTEISTSNYSMRVTNDRQFGSGALSDKMLLIRVIEIYKIDAYFRPG